jgi:hypothetical protein
MFFILPHVLLYTCYCIVATFSYLPPGNASFEWHLLLFFMNKNVYWSSKLLTKSPYSHGQNLRELFLSSVGDPDPHVLGLPDPEVIGKDPDPAPEPDPSLFS